MHDGHEVRPPAREHGHCQPRVSAELAQLVAMLEANPLVRFSVYTHIQAAFLRERGQEILRLMDRASVGGATPSLTQTVYPEFWLWVFGAYEVVRTMSIGQGCFSPSLTVRLVDLKKQLTPLRMVLAKQERAGHQGNIDADGSIAGFGLENKDLVFLLDGKQPRRLSARELIRTVEELFAGIRLEDVLLDFRDRPQESSQPVEDPAEGGASKRDSEDFRLT